MNAVVIDGLLLAVPSLLCCYLLSLLFPHRGFLLVHSPTPGSATVFIGASGLLVVCAISLSYFAVFEGLYGQTRGKRRMGLCVRSASGGRAGLLAVSTRNVLRLLDGLVFYAIGLVVALLTGARRRRIGDWVGGTVVLREQECEPHRSLRQPWRAAIFPAACFAAVFVAIFGASIGVAVGQSEQAIALVRSYEHARETGNAELACSMLTVAQQRELVAIQQEDYATAAASSCPRFILGTVPGSHLMSPELPRLAASPLYAAFTPVGGLVVYSPETSLHLIVSDENGRLRLDERAIEKLEFVRGCVAAGRFSSSSCVCTFEDARAQGTLALSSSSAGVLQTLATDARRCAGLVGTGSST
jgi:uncharacterized RDD family membrane protein YckC